VLLREPLTTWLTRRRVVKLWDLRKTHTKRANPVPVAASHDLTRGRGLSSLAQGSNGTRLHALGIDSSLYTLDPLALAHDEHLLPAVRPNGLAQGNATFYVRLAVRPCGRFVVSGTSKNDALVWDSEAPAYAAPVRLSGHKGEVGAVDWGRDAVRPLYSPSHRIDANPTAQIATCGDDMQVRLWRPSTVMARRCQADEELRNWHWSGAWPRPAAHP
jgi:denticleless